MYQTLARFGLSFACLLGVAACGGSSGAGPANAPRIVSIQATSGFAIGGAVVQITGANFQDSTQVTFDGVPGTNVVRLDASLLQVTSPAHAPGSVDVQVASAAGANTLTGAFTYVAYPIVAGSPDLPLDSGAVAPLLISRPQICCSGASRFVVWAEERAAATGNRDVFFQRSTNRGASWLVTDLQINTSAQGTSDSADPLICCDGQNVYVAWLDSRRGTPEPFFNRSTDGGVTWLAVDVQLNAPLLPGTTAAPRSLSMCCEGSNIYLAWTDDRSNLGVAWDVFATRSTDAGATFLPVQPRLNTNAPGLLPNPAPLPRICCEGSNVYVAWDDHRGGAAISDVRFSRSVDNGTSWLGTDIRLDMNTTNRTAYNPKICCDGNNVHVAWLDDRNAASPAVAADVYARSSTDGGVSFGASDTRVSTYPPGTLIPSGTGVNVCCAGSNFYLTWADTRNGGPDAWFNRSADAGVTYQVADVKVDVGTVAGAVSNGQPTLCCGASGSVVIAWEDVRSGLADVFTNVSADFGATWAAMDKRLDTDVPNPGGSFVGVRQGVCCEGAFFTVVWIDDRNNLGAGFDMFANGNVEQ